VVRGNDYDYEHRCAEHEHESHGESVSASHCS
jgi:hypothetical protein